MIKHIYEPKGVIPACLLPFDDKLDIDERAYRRHLTDVASVEGITAITANGHAGEVSSLTFDEQRRVAAITKAELGSRIPMIVGVFTNNSLEAGRLARMSQDERADALLVFP